MPESSHPAPGPRRRLRAQPALWTALLAAAVRSAAVADGLANNPLVQLPDLDADIYLRWAKEIAAGDVLGREGSVDGAPFLFNPLYAYLLAPLAAVFGDAMLVPGLCLNVAFGVAATWFSARAAERWAGPVAGWIAGVAVACSAVLVHLDAHLAVSELAAMLVAGSCWSMSPGPDGRAERGHGPVATGLWLGIGAIARPVTQLVLPFAAWLAARRAEPGRKLRAAGVVVAVFFATAVPTFTRNLVVAGEPVLWTAAGGINLHLGNNPDGWKYRGMLSSHFRFAPETMHGDAMLFVRQATGKWPTSTEVGKYFTDLAVRQALADPVPAAMHLVGKARWFFGPVEIPSSSSLPQDQSFQPWLRLAFVPTWVLAALAGGAAFLLRRRTDLLLGAGALVLAHLAVLTLIFPLSHYRSPAVPAMAVLGAAGVAAAVSAWRGRRERAPAVTLAAATAVVAGIGWAPPQPDVLRFRDAASLVVSYRDLGDLDKAEWWANRAIEIHLEDWPGDPVPAIGWQALGEIRFRRNNWKGALEAFDQGVLRTPNNPILHCWISWSYEKLDDFASAETAARKAMSVAPWHPEGYERLGDLLSKVPGREGEARESLLKVRELGGRENHDALRRVGLTPLR